MADQPDLGAFERTVRSFDKTVPEAVDPDDLAATARAMVADGKGILAADESNGTASKRLRAVDVEATSETRRQYRQMLLTAPGLEGHIAGVILYDETVRQATDDGTSFVDVLTERGILPGIKVDTGTIPLSGHPGEKVTSGLDGLRERLGEYRTRGLRFAKWRAVISIDEGRPSTACLQANAHAMARYASTCHEAGIVPMVEPEVVMDGDHGLERDQEVTAAILRATFDHLLDQDVDLEGVILKTNMVLPGEDSDEDPSPEEVAEATLACLRDTVPASVPGVAFLSGGQSALDATVRLNAINAASGLAPWRLTFSYGRALQGPPIQAWAGDAAAVEAAQRLLVHRARCNGAASMGTYKPEMEDEAAAA